MSFSNVCLKVRHNGKPKVVGKIATIDGNEVFYHAHRSSQRHRLLDALAIDVSVLNWLKIHQIGEVHYYDVEQRILRVAWITDFLAVGIRKDWGNRDRYYLPLKFWEQTKRWYEKPPWASIEVIVNEQVTV